MHGILPVLHDLARATQRRSFRKALICLFAGIVVTTLFAACPIPIYTTTGHVRGSDGFRTSGMSRVGPFHSCYVYTWQTPSRSDERLSNVQSVDQWIRRSIAAYRAGSREPVPSVLDEGKKKVVGALIEWQESGFPFRCTYTIVMYVHFSHPDPGVTTYLSGPRLRVADSSHRMGSTVVRPGHCKLIGTSANIIAHAMFVAMIWWMVSFTRLHVRRLRRSRAARMGKCVSCGYDMQGLPRIVCPECGNDSVTL